MRKTSAMLLAVVLVMALAVVSVSAATVTYDAMADWDTENADGSSVPWKYVHSNDVGSTFEVMSVYEDRDYGAGWFMSSDSWDGFIINDDFPGVFEGNASQGNAGISGISFVAPEDGDYVIKAFTITVTSGQQGDTFYIKKGSTEVYSSALGYGEEGDEFVLNVPETAITLSADDEVTFYGTYAPNPNDDQWLSVYFDGLAVEGPGGETGETTDEETPETGDSRTSAPIYFLITGIVVLAAILVLSKKSQRDQA